MEYRSNNANRLVQRLCRDPALVARLRSDPASVFREHGLSAKEGEALASGDPAALASVGIHPILQVHLMMAMSPQMADLVNMRAFARRLGEQ